MVSLSKKILLHISLQEHLNLRLCLNTNCIGSSTSLQVPGNNQVNKGKQDSIHKEQSSEVCLWLGGTDSDAPSVFAGS